VGEEDKRVMVWIAEGEGGAKPPVIPVGIYVLTTYFGHVCLYERKLPLPTWSRIENSAGAMSRETLEKTWFESSMVCFYVLEYTKISLLMLLQSRNVKATQG